MHDTACLTRALVTRDKDLSFYTRHCRNLLKQLPVLQGIADRFRVRFSQPHAHAAITMAYLLKSGGKLHRGMRYLADYRVKRGFVG
jgi:hypothetical protein